MKIFNSLREGITNALIILTTASFLAVFLSSCSTGPVAASAQKTPTPAGAVSAPSPATADQGDAQRREQWQEEISKVPLQKKGCFSASYPEKEWKEAPCGVPSKYPNQPARRPRPNNVGNGTDVTTRVPASLISSAIGSFDSVTPNTVTETGAWGGNPTSPNAFTLQLNSQFFTTTACNGHAGCLGWQQFIYSQNQCSGPCVFMEYWLINYGPACPAGPWIQSGNSCWFNSVNSSAPAVTAAQLQGTVLTGNAGAVTDSVVITTAGGTATATAADSVVNLSQSWNTVEWNIFGDCCSGQANFSAGTSIVPRTRVISGSQSAPNCVGQGFTAETNNLNFGPGAPGASSPGPALIFNESSAGGVSTCAAATTVGDTHLATFGGLFYDFQASGEFVLAQVDRDFVVQTRQVSGAPTWPDASVNSAVATRMGNDKVAICLPGQLNVNGANTDLADGSSMSTTDVDIWRKGNVYYILGQSGDAVRATVSPTWIDVSVGLGHWPANVTGLLANVDGNVNKIAMRDGTVLTNPFSFDEFYHRYGESWRVARGESLLSVCGGKEVESGNPRRPFYAKDLDPKVSEHTRAVCAAAGVKEGPLLDACTLDVAVIGDDAAAKTFVGMPAPGAVGTFVGASGEGISGTRVWWLLGLVLIVIAIILWILWRRKKGGTT